RTRAPNALLLPTPVRRRWVYSLLLVGALGTVYWAFLLRAWLPMETTRPQNGFSHLAEDEFDVRDAFHRLDQFAAPDAVLHFRPIDPTVDRKAEVMAPNEYFQRMLVMDAGHQWLNAEEKCATHFGGDPAACAAIQSASRQLFAMPSPDTKAAEAFCRQFGVAYLIVSAWDPQWSEHQGWPAGLPNVVQDPRFRILACR
ncbi:MAG: hypothetical protein INR62_06760, partial [Rhodospirillales bacterium]|nr:hypothetical protein [Acetobacter sp.]